LKDKEEKEKKKKKEKKTESEALFDDGRHFLFPQAERGKGKKKKGEKKGKGKKKPSLPTSCSREGGERTQELFLIGLFVSPTWQTTVKEKKKKKKKKGGGKRTAPRGFSRSLPPSRR